MTKRVLAAVAGIMFTFVGGVAASSPSRTEAGETWAVDGAADLGEAAQLSLDGHAYDKSISPREAWVNTGIKVLEGQILSVQASGKVSTLPQSEGSVSGPEGQGAYCNAECTLPKGSFGQLIGKIGETGSAFVIGSRYAAQSHENGVLFLGVNDCCNWSDNTGAFQAKIVLFDASVCNDPETRAIFDHGPDSNYHHYEKSFTICSKSTPCCTVSKVFDLMVSQLRFIAPTDDMSPVENCGVVVLIGNNPVRTVIDYNEYSVGNYTKVGHDFHPGRVVRTVADVGDAVVVTTLGEGNGDDRWLNENFFSYTWPRLVDPKLWLEKLLLACSKP